MIITKDMTIDELIKNDERAVNVLMQSGMNCIGCASSAGETLEEAALEHGIDPVLLVRKLNLYLTGQLI
jgi:hybrid cluster-associated redox disulfide protein